MSSWAPLAGMSVVEGCQRLVGPLAAWQLSLLGAEVTKVEPPAGDIARGFGAVFDLMNAHKRCAAVDLADDRLFRGRTAEAWRFWRRRPSVNE